MSESGSAVPIMQGGVKRQREREAADRRQEQRVEDVVAHTTQIVDSIAGINTNYALTLNDERARLARRVEDLQAQHTTDSVRQSEETTRLVLHKLNSFRGAVSGSIKDRLITALRAQVDQGSAEVLDAVTAHVDDALQSSLTVADTQLSAERQLSSRLVEQLRTYAQTLLEHAKAANQRAFQAEVQAMQKDVLLAKVRASHLADQNKLVRHEQEVDALMRVVAQLAEKSRFVESARSEVQKAKRHVRWLEQYLDLNGIVAAAQADTVAAPSSSAAPPLPPPPMPDAALRQSAPHYFALKMLAHKDITLTELVDSWQSQEKRIEEAERKYARLEEVMGQVQHDALVVHQRYLEEKQRREIADRRITDMVRERLHPQTEDRVFQEVQRLRWAYTEVVDDAAQLAVNLKVSRDEQRSTQAEVARLRAQVRQLQRDAETDQVALTIQELRREYAERVRAIEATTARSQLELQLARQVSTQYSTVAAEATTALRQIAHANAELTAVSAPVPAAAAAAANKPFLQRQEPSWEAEAQRVERQAEKVLAMTSAIKNYGLEHGQLYEEQMAALMRQWAKARSVEKEGEAREANLVGNQARSGEQTSSLGPSSSSSPLQSRTLVSSSHDKDSSKSLDSIMDSSKLALREALSLLVASLQSTDVERSNLLDASLSDAQYVTELMKEISAVTSERDRLRAQVAVCRDLLEKNHVTIVERALMHDVPVEDSLNVAEAGERITVLRDQLAAAKQLCDRALNEVRVVTGEKEAAEAKLMELTRGHEVLQRHAARLTEQLQSSLSTEAALMEKTVQLQQQVTELVQSGAATDHPRDASHQSNEEDATEVSPQSRTTPSQLSALFTTLSDTLLRLDEEVRTLRSHQAERKTGDSHTASSGALASAGQQRDNVNAEDSSDAALLESLSRSGMMNVVQVLKDTLHQAGLLRASLTTAAGARAAALCEAATTQPQADAAPSAGASVVPLPAADTQRRAFEHASALQEAKVAELSAERQQMRERLQRAEQTASEMEAANQRLLTISKSVLEKQGLLKVENERLRAQVRELTAPPEAPTPAVQAPAEVAAAPVSVAQEAPPIPVSVQPVEATPEPPQQQEPVHHQVEEESSVPPNEDPQFSVMAEPVKALQVELTPGNSEQENEETEAIEKAQVNEEEEEASQHQAQAEVAENVKGDEQDANEELPEEPAQN